MDFLKAEWHRLMVANYDVLALLSAPEDLHFYVEQQQEGSIQLRQITKKSWCMRWRFFIELSF